MDLFQAIKEYDIVAAEIIIKQQLEQRPQDIALWFKMCLTELKFPFEDYISALECLKKIYALSPNCIDALILEVSINWHNFGFISDELFEKLSKVNIDDNKKMSIIYYLKSLYYHLENDLQDKKNCLEKALRFCDDFVYPYRDFGKVLLEEGCCNESKEMFNKALKNIIKVYQANDFYDFTDIETYISEFVTGTKISQINYECIKELAMKID